MRDILQPHIGMENLTYHVAKFGDNTSGTWSNKLTPVFSAFEDSLKSTTIHREQPLQFFNLTLVPTNTMHGLFVFQ